MLESRGINAEVVHVPTIKPLDARNNYSQVSERLAGSLLPKKHKLAGGFGGAVAELLAETLANASQTNWYATIVLVNRVLQMNSFEYFGLTGESIAETIAEFVAGTPQYHR